MNAKPQIKYINSCPSSALPFSCAFMLTKYSEKEHLYVCFDSFLSVPGSCCHWGDLIPVGYSCKTRTNNMKAVSCIYCIQYWKLLTVTNHRSLPSYWSRFYVLWSSEKSWGNVDISAYLEDTELLAGFTFVVQIFGDWPFWGPSWSLYLLKGVVPVGVQNTWRCWRGQSSASSIPCMFEWQSPGLQQRQLCTRRTCRIGTPSKQTTGIR